MLKTIYFFWYQGIDNAPKVVHICLASWRMHNPEWNLVILDKTNYREWTDLRYDGAMTLTLFSDYLRLSLLAKHGGLWVDATCYCNVPLDKWLPGDCFLFENFNIQYTISTWFIYSEPGHHLITTWLNCANNANSVNCANNANSLDMDSLQNHYFIFHEVFDTLCTENENFRKMWEIIPKINQNDPMMYFDREKKGGLHITNDCALQQLTEESKQMILQKQKYVFKLSHKCLNEVPEGSILAYLASIMDAM